MLLPQTFSRERSFYIPTAKVFPLESFAVYGITFGCLSRQGQEEAAGHNS